MLRKPVPTGVVIGALSAHLVRRTLSIVESGMGVPKRSITSTPASWTSQLICTPVASIHLRAASASSGPVPSPVISVTSWAILHLLISFTCFQAGSAFRDLERRHPRSGGSRCNAIFWWEEHCEAGYHTL